MKNEVFEFEYLQKYLLLSQKSNMLAFAGEDATMHAYE
jgi:hypothetical protein